MMTRAALVVLASTLLCASGVSQKKEALKTIDDLVNSARGVQKSYGIMEKAVTDHVIESAKLADVIRNLPRVQHGNLLGKIANEPDGKELTKIVNNLNMKSISAEIDEAVKKAEAEAASAGAPLPVPSETSLTQRAVLTSEHNRVEIGGVAVNRVELRGSKADLEKILKQQDGLLRASKRAKLTASSRQVEPGRVVLHIPEATDYLRVLSKLTRDPSAWCKSPEAEVCVQSCRATGKSPEPGTVSVTLSCKGGPKLELTTNGAIKVGFDAGPASFTISLGK